MKKCSLITRSLAALAILTAAGACAWLDDVTGFTKSRLETGPPAGGNRGSTGVPASPKDSSLMVTAVVFPEGYCWQRDSSGEKAECRIVLFCNGSVIVDIPAGAGHPASSDPDMHRCIDGKLYTDFSTADRTAVYENGNLLFSYEGREMICGFLVRDGDIYTLGQNRSGEGFSFRKNGKAIYSSMTGRVFGTSGNPSGKTGALYEDAGDIVFCFSSTVVSQGSATTSYHIVREGVPETLTFPDAVKKVYDIRQIEGSIVAAVQHITPARYPALVVDGKLKSLPVSLNNSLIGNCQLRWDGTGSIWFNVTYSQDNWKSIRYMLIRTSNNSRIMFNAGVTVYDLWTSGVDYAFALDTNGSISLIYNIGGAKREVELKDTRYSLLSPACMKFNGKKIIAGLSPRDSTGFPVIINGTGTETLKINGYITSVDYYETK